MHGAANATCRRTVGEGGRKKRGGGEKVSIYGENRGQGEEGRDANISAGRLRLEPAGPPPRWREDPPAPPPLKAVPKQEGSSRVTGRFRRAAKQKREGLGLTTRWRTQQGPEMRARKGKKA